MQTRYRGPHVHRVLGYDRAANTLECSNCGTVRLTFKEGRPKCSVARAQQRHKNGSRRVDREGYVRVLVDGRGVYEHRHVMAERLGRPLLDHEEVHHKNGVRHDNAPGNLELWSTSQPKGQRVEDKLAWAREIIALYGDGPGLS